MFDVPQVAASWVASSLILALAVVSRSLGLEIELLLYSGNLLVDEGTASRLIGLCVVVPSLLALCSSSAPTCSCSATNCVLWCSTYILLRLNLVYYTIMSW